MKSYMYASRLCESSLVILRQLQPKRGNVLMPTNASTLSSEAEKTLAMIKLLTAEQEKNPRTRHHYSVHVLLNHSRSKMLLRLPKKPPKRMTFLEELVSGSRTAMIISLLSEIANDLLLNHIDACIPGLSRHLWLRFKG
jgi:hypothetical protein